MVRIEPDDDIVLVLADPVLGSIASSHRRLDRVGDVAGVNAGQSGFDSVDLTRISGLP